MIDMADIVSREPLTASPISMVDRVVLILGVFEDSAEALTAGQVSVRSGLPRSSVHRILQQLEGARWLRRQEHGYTLGLRVFEIGSLVGQRRPVAEGGRAGV